MPYLHIFENQPLSFHNRCVILFTIAIFNFFFSYGMAVFKIIVFCGTLLPIPCNYIIILIDRNGVDTDFGMEVTMPKNIDREIEALYSLLAEALDHFGPDELFLSVREIMRKHRVSRRTVDKALARLAEEQQIVVKSGRGIFVSRNRCKKSRVIASVHYDWPAEYWKDLDTALEKEIRNYPNFKFTRAFFEPTIGSNYLHYLETLNVDAMLLTLPVQPLSRHEIAAILELPVPVIFLENNILCDGINAVDSMPEYSGMMAAECLIRNGHRRLALIQSEPWSMGDRRRNDGFLNYARLHGIEPLIVDCKVQSGEASCAKTHDRLLEFLKQNGPAFTGCFTMSDYSALGVISALKEYGLQVSGDVSVIGDSGIPSGANFDPPLTTVAHDIPTMVKIIGQGLNELFNGSSFGIRIVPPILLERQSVKNINLTPEAAFQSFLMERNKNEVERANFKK